MTIVVEIEEINFDKGLLNLNIFIHIVRTDESKKKPNILLTKNITKLFKFFTFDLKTNMPFKKYNKITVVENEIKLEII